MTPIFGTTDPAEMARHADCQLAIDASTLGWTGLGTGLGLFWLDRPEQAAGSLVAQAAHCPTLLPQHECLR